MGKAVILMNLGSPDSTSVKDVKRYLDEFLMDERVIDKPWLFRAMLVKGIIVPFRAPKSAGAYRSIWTEKGSPLLVLSRELRDAVRQQLREPVEIAMRYGNPSPAFAFEQLQRLDPELDEVIVIPMYPHFAMSSYETAVEYAKKQHADAKHTFKLSFIRPYYDNEKYLEALTESIRPYLAKDYDHIVFSYHGIPERHVLKTDVTGSHCLRAADCCEDPSAAHQFCYRHQCIISTNTVAGRLNIPASKFSWSFQSRLGRDEWLKPYTAMRLEQMPGEGIRNLLVVCPAFVSDCLETLEEMAEEGKEIFLQSGGGSFTLIPCLNSHPLWVSAIAGWIKDFIGGNEELRLA